MKTALQYGKSLRSCILSGKGGEGDPGIYGISKARVVSVLPDSLRVVAAIKLPAAAGRSLDLSSAASPRLACKERGFIPALGRHSFLLNSFLGKVYLH